MNLSLVIITKNEERSLAKVIDSCHNLIDEIVIIDSGSTDNTIAIAQQYNARIIQQEFLGFGKQKQFAVNNAINDWVLCLDADEALTDDIRNNIMNELINPKFNAYTLTRCNKFLGKFLQHGAGYPDLSIRLFNRKFANWSNDAVHEKVLASCKVGKISGDYLHDSAESLDKYLTKQNQYTSAQAIRLFNDGKKFKLSKLTISPIWHFIKYYFIKRGFLDGVPGLVHILIGSWNSFSKYIKLYELIYSHHKAY